MDTGGPKPKGQDLETGSLTLETKVIRDREQVEQAVVGFLRRAAMDTPPFVYTVTDRNNPGQATRILKLIDELRAARPAFEGRYITDIQEDNLEDVKRIQESGIQVRHISGNRIGFSVSKNEYLNHYQEQPQERVGYSALVYSNNADLVMQMQEVFRVLWNTAVTAEARIKQIEIGVESGETRVITDLHESHVVGRDLLKSAEKEALIILASRRTMERNSKFYQDLLDKTRQTGLKVRLLGPLSGREADPMGLVETRRVEPISVGIAIYDRKSMLITQYVDPEADKSEQALLSNIYTTDTQTISGMVALFEALWRESGKKEAEERERAQAEMLQDILTHDIRNYNQIALTAIESLQDQLGQSPLVGDSLEQMEAAVMGSTELVEKASRLGRILSNKERSAVPVDLLRTLSVSLQHVTDSNPHKSVRHELRTEDGGVPVVVLADELLGDAFVNIYSNSLRYTEEKEVGIETVVSRVEEGLDGKRRAYWRILISDAGVGIPEEVRDKFVRYREGSRGKGLGLSIVHALVVGRYGGRLTISNRIQTEQVRGTRVEVVLPAGPG